MFNNDNIHFLDIKILNNGETDIHIKDTNTGLYAQYHSYEHWNTKAAWVCSVYDRTENLQQPKVIYDASKLFENSYVMEWISSLHQD